MTVKIVGNHKVVSADSGYWLTDGESISDELLMPIDADTSGWREISEQEKNDIEAEIMAQTNGKEVGDVQE